MTTAAGADDVIGTTAIQLAPFTRQFDRGFTGFRAAVEQVTLVAAGVIAQPIDEVQLGAVVQAVARVDQHMSLIGQGFDQYLRAMTEAVGGAALAEIQIGALVAAPEPGALATHKHLRGPCHSRHQGFTEAVMARVHDQIVQARRRATKQIHSSPPIATGPWSTPRTNTPLRFFALPM